MAIKVTLQGDRIENPDYIREHKLKPDYEFYNKSNYETNHKYLLCA